jgi:membrane protein implicated in regulation of membrane protease activity
MENKVVDTAKEANKEKLAKILVFIITIGTIALFVGVYGTVWLAMGWFVPTYMAMVAFLAVAVVALNRQVWNKNKTKKE